MLKELVQELNQILNQILTEVEDLTNENEKLKIEKDTISSQLVAANKSLMVALEDKTALETEVSNLNATIENLKSLLGELDNPTPPTNSTTPTGSDTVRFSLRKSNDFNTNKISTFSDDDNNYNITINNMDFTEGNVEGYSGWTERGLQISNKSTINMDYIQAKSIEININTINWEIRRSCFALAAICEDGSEYIIRGYSWKSPSMYVFPIDNETTSVDSGNLSSVEFENGVDTYHSIVFVFNDTGYTTYIDGVLGKTYTKTVLKNVVGIKLYSSDAIYSAAPYESIIFYKNELTESEVVSNYNKFISRISTTGYENMPISTQTEFNTVADMVIANLTENSIVTTKGYNSIGDNGNAKYKIVTYDTFYDELPEDCKKVQINGQSKTTVDNFGNHKLGNGLVAKLISDDGTFTPEQWGAIGDGVTSDTEAFICMLALTKTGTINLKDGAIYLITSRTKNACSQYTDNRYLKSMIGKFSGGCHRPLIANCNNLVLNGNPSGDGNKATMKIAENDFGFGMGMLSLGKRIEGLEIKNIIFDSNGLTMMETSVKGVANKTSNHTIVYDPGDDLTQSVLDNLNIHHCKFLSNGTCVDTSDQGGDHILIINPTTSNHVYIEDNEFYDWGRWVLSVDLGGKGERFYDYKFNRNICKCTDNNYFVKIGNGAKTFRGLGWIDFEARKCWTGLEVCGNTLEGLVGFAMNGNGKMLENFTFSDNNILYTARNWRSAYPYFINFYSVTCAKNSIIENNKIDAPWSIVPSKYAIDGLSYRNNTTPQTSLTLHGLYGNIIIDNNQREGNGNIVQIDEALYLPDYLDETTEKVCNFVFTNNGGGIKGTNNKLGAMLFKPSSPEDYNFINVTIEGNSMLDINLSALGNKPFNFDTSQVIGEVPYGFAVRGAKFIGTTKSLPVNMPILGCGMYEEGDLIAENVAMRRMDSAIMPKFYSDYLVGGTFNIYCSKSGYLPQMYTDTMLIYNQTIEYGRYYFTDDNLYIAQNSGTTPAEGDLPNHTSGAQLFGNVNFYWIAPIGRIRTEQVI